MALYNTRRITDSMIQHLSLHLLISSCRIRHTIWLRDWSSDVWTSDLAGNVGRHTGRANAAQAPAGTCCGKVAAHGSARLLCLLCGTHESVSSGRISLRSMSRMAPCLKATKPTKQADPLCQASCHP